VAAAALVAMAMSVLAGSAWAGDDGAAAREDRMVPYTVRPGDTLWAIARRVGGPGIDPRPLVDAIAHRNGLTGSVIQPGASILVPQPGD
jgi:nucleoid-associated protein YgaU